MQLKQLKLASMPQMPTEKTTRAWIQLHRTHRQLLEAVAAELKSHDLPPLDWYDVLLELRRAESTGLRQFEIGEKILLSKHNLSRLIDRLQNQGLVVREICEEDGRGNRIKITAQGEQVLKQTWPVYGQAIQRQIGDRLSQKETAQLAELLNKLLEDSDS